MFAAIEQLLLQRLRPFENVAHQCTRHAGPFAELAGQIGDKAVCRQGGFVERFLGALPLGLRDVLGVDGDLCFGPIRACAQLSRSAGS